METECRSVWAGRFVLCTAAGAASFLERNSPWTGSSRTDRKACGAQNDNVKLAHFAKPKTILT